MQDLKCVLPFVLERERKHMLEQNRRKHPRCEKDTAVTYLFLTGATQTDAVARNYSRFGMYLETSESLEPGTIIAIRNVACGGDGAPENALVSSSGDTGMTGACQELNTQVVGEVKRCDKIKAETATRYGIAVRYLSPAT
jgi:hypothetical protein